MTDPRRTQNLGKYQILQKLGKGGFGTVYRALDTTLDREVALKVLDPLLMRDETWVARFRREAKVIARLKHPHIVHIYEVSETEGRLYITMELTAGPHLNDLIAAPDHLTWDQTLDIVAQIADALDYAHNADVIHRDLKPSNILLDERAGVVLTDFGFAKLVGESSMSVSVSGGVVGTPPYIAPEVWEGMEAGPGTDVYALSCVLFEMLTGDVLFKGNTPPAVMMAHFQPRQYPEQWPEGVPPEVEGLLEKALARDPVNRYPSAGAFAADLQAVAERTADPLAETYQALQVALDAQEWESALELAQEITAQDPGYRNVSVLAQRATESLEQAERARWATQWREQAVEAERSGQLDAARAAMQHWLEMAPGDEDAQAMLVRLSVDPLDEPYQALQAALAAEEWKRALRLAQEITAQDPGYRDVSELAQRAAQGQAQVSQAQQITQWRERALAAEKRGERETAQRAVERWLELAPGDAEAQSLQERLSAPRPVEPRPRPKVAKTTQPPAKTGASTAPARAPYKPQPKTSRRIPAWLWVLGGLGIIFAFLVFVLPSMTKEMTVHVEVTRVVVEKQTVVEMVVEKQTVVETVVETVVVEVLVEVTPTETRLPAIDYTPIARIVLPDEPDQEEFIRAVEEKDGFVYLLSREGSLYTYDISEMSSQQPITSYESPLSSLSLSDGNGVLRNGDYIYAFGWRGIEVLDVQNASTPTILDSRRDLSVNNLIQHENYLIATGRHSIAVYNIDDASSPTLLSVFEVGADGIFSAAVYGDTLYTSEFVHDEYEGLRIFDFGDPSNLRSIGFIDQSETAYHLKIVGDQLIECTTSEVRLWNLDTPTDPSLQAAAPGKARGCAFDGRNIVVMGKALRPYDSELVTIATFDDWGGHVDGFPYGSVVTPDFIFLARHSGVLVLSRAFTE